MNFSPAKFSRNERAQKTHSHWVGRVPVDRVRSSGGRRRTRQEVDEE